MRIGYNVGSGQRPFTSNAEVDWTNVDKIQHPGMPLPDLLADGAHLPVADGSADYFVLHHVLEHFWPPHAQELVKEAYRVLKPGGSLLVFVPDMRELAYKWLEGGMTTQLYLTSVYGAFMGHDEDRHKWGFDERSLFEFLGCAPWKLTKRFDWRVIPGSDLARDFWVLDMECVR